MKMRLSGNSVLGIAIGERNITVAEIAPVRGQRGAWEVRKSAEFTSVGDDEATEKQAFETFLKDSRLSASKVVVGVPAKWIVGREKDVPPSSPEQAAAILRLQAERAFSADLGDLVLDYAGVPDEASSKSVLLMGIRRKQFDRAVSLGSVAGEVIAVMPSTLALVGASSDSLAAEPADGMLLSVTDNSVELSVRAGGSPRMLRHLTVRGPDLISQNGMRAAALTSLAGEIRRITAVTAGVKPQDMPFRVWDAVGLESSAAEALAKQIGGDVRVISKLPGNRIAATRLAQNTQIDAARFGPAVAVALAGAQRDPGLVDFLHPKLVPPARSNWERSRVLTLAIVAAAVIVGALFWYDYHLRSSVAASQATLGSLTRSADHLMRLDSRIRDARGWFSSRTPTLECLRVISECFPESEPIYVTNLTLREDGQGTIVGRAPSQESATRLWDRLKANKQFVRIDSPSLGTLAGNGRDTSFTINFQFVAMETSPQVKPEGTR